MLGKLTVIPADPGKPITTKEIVAPPQLVELQMAVGGYLEMIPYWPPDDRMVAVAFCNEHGKLEQLPMNERATLMWGPVALRLRDRLLGDVVVIEGDRELMAEL